MTPADTLEVAAFGYHDVVERTQASGFQRPGARAYKLTPAGFAAHLDRIAAGPFAPGLIRDLDPARPGRHLLLTFDDGGRSALRIGEELCKRGWRGHFFVITGRVGQSGFLDARELRELHRAGHVIGTHSHSHPDIFRELPAARMLEEWRVSKVQLEDLLGEPCTSGSVPGGDISSTVLSTAASAGLLHLLTSEPVTRPRLVGGCLVLGRYVIKTGTSAERIAQLATFRGWRRALLVRRLKEVGRRVLPAPYRWYVRYQTGVRASAGGGPGAR